MGYRITKHPDREIFRVEQKVDSQWIPVSNGMGLGDARLIMEQFRDRDREWIVVEE